MEDPQTPAIRIFVDADACPVKQEIYRVAERYDLKVFIVANSFMNVPRSEMIERVIVSEGPDIADDWIVERATTNDIVVTADIPLAGRCVRKGATVISPTGKAVRRQFHGHGAGDPRPDDRPALGRRRHARAAAAQPAGHFALSLGARSGGHTIEEEVESVILRCERSEPRRMNGRHPSRPACGGRLRVTYYSAAAATPPCAFDQPAGSFMKVSTSASILESYLPLAFATASTSHHVVR